MRNQKIYRLLLTFKDDSNNILATVYSLQKNTEVHIPLEMTNLKMVYLLEHVGTAGVHVSVSVHVRLG